MTFLIQSKSDFIPLLYTDVRWNNLVFWHLRWELRTFHFRLRSAAFNETVWNLIRFHMKICLRQSKLARVRYFTFLTSIIVTSHNTGTYYTYSQHTSKTSNVIWDGNCLLVHEECKAWSKRFLWGNVIKYCRTSSSSANIFSFNLSQTSHTRTTLAVVRCSHEILRLFSHAKIWFSSFHVALSSHSANLEVFCERFLPHFIEKSGEGSQKIKVVVGLFTKI